MAENEHESETEVNVTVPAPEPEPAEITPVTTVITTPESNDGVEPEVMAQLIEQQRVNAELAQRIVELESAQSATVAAVAAVADDAAVAESAAVAAVAAVAESEAAEHTAENDDEPRHRTHPYWSSIGGGDE